MKPETTQATAVPEAKNISGLDLVRSKRIVVVDGTFWGNGQFSLECITVRNIDHPKPKMVYSDPFRITARQIDALTQELKQELEESETNPYLVNPNSLLRENLTTIREYTEPFLELS